MPKSFRSFRCLLLVLSSASLAACNSSGSNSPVERADVDDDRPAAVSSDAATTRDDTGSQSSLQSDNTESALADDPDSHIATEDQTSVEDNSDVANVSPDGEIKTIADLLAHLEARRLDEDRNETEQQTESVTEPDTSGDAAENLPVADLVTDETPDTVASEDEQPADSEPSQESLDTADTSPLETTSDPVVDDSGENQTEDLPVETDPQTGDAGEGGVADAPAEVDTDSDGTQDQVTDEGAAEAEGLLQDDPAVTEVPEDTTSNESFSSDKNDIVLDCKQQLPCAASNADGAVAVVVENVYRHPQTRRLAIALSVTANRDTALRWDNDITSTDDVATTYNGTSREFSGFYQFDSDNDMVTLLAGTTLLVVQHFREMPSETTVSMVRFDTGYIEAGVRTALQFTNMPLDPVLGDIVDCADQVPCTWVANDQSYAVNVLKTSGLWQTGRLRVDFEVRSTVGMGINHFSSEPAVGNDGSVFTPRTHSLGSTSDYQEFTVQLVAEGVLIGYQDFLKNANRQATSLVQVKLGMTRVNAPGAGSPVFRNLPLE